MRALRRSFATLTPLTIVLLLSLPACDGNDTPTSPDVIVPPTAAVVAAMNAAIQVEYRTKMTYEKVIEDLGAVLPFSQIVSSEAQHVAVVANLFTRRGMAVPQASTDADTIPAFATVQAACTYAVEAERAVIALYNGYLAQTLPADVRQVFTNMRDVSLSNHLPAFRACCACR